MDVGGGPPRDRFSIIHSRVFFGPDIARLGFPKFPYRHRIRLAYRRRQLTLNETRIGPGGDDGNRALASAVAQRREKMNLGDSVNGNLLDDCPQKAIARLGPNTGAHRAPTATTGGA